MSAKSLIVQPATPPGATEGFTAVDGTPTQALVSGSIIWERITELHLDKEFQANLLDLAELHRRDPRLSKDDESKMRSANVAAEMFVKELQEKARGIIRRPVRPPSKSGRGKPS
jgi:hypothetical protein